MVVVIRVIGENWWNRVLLIRVMYNGVKMVNSSIFGMFR